MSEPAPSPHEHGPLAPVIDLARERARRLHPAGRVRPPLR